ncbi:MAG: phosphate ABC transporter permease subunit PstC, partial [Clostridia bacterium]|nr:phosphate ABC transporter permease subunit PstC [Clostridia bacterium]
AWASIRTFGWSFLISSAWDPVQEEFGALPFIYGTVMSSLLALLFAVPVSVGIALFLSEVAPGPLRRVLSFTVELLAAIPSVVYGLWGLFVLVPWLRKTVMQPLADAYGWLPLFRGPAYGPSLLAGGLILAIMVLPIITAVAREVFLAVPVSQREAALALGATRWEMIRMALLPYARSGLVGAVILGLGRAIGETMAVTMVIGNSPEIHASLLQPSHTLASVIANEFSEATSDLHLSALMESGLLLFAVAVLVNIGARFLVWRVTRHFVG